ncbi:TPA_asm: RNA-directed RNA polymerase [ssRNA phage SRR7976325_17]|uniref:RNA-directed RNA polymerase n=1 Tax=ssRNA phage SRR7976325_17 TaxID=2786704 RepID=A0A8S5L1H4_9VIRU|nr:RNA-directed RNA polymerase [ssRNA phage SRR7976325_17]DAD51205.1 TPA_asm: RNA-directed RNA polymerase [ssRNA phage SRR7976325_17]
MTVKHGSVDLFKVECKLVSTICEDVDTPRSLAIFLLIRHQEWSQLAHIAISPANYRECDVDQFRFDYLVSSLLKKNPRLPTGIDRAAVAVSKFREAERMCALSNERLWDFQSGSWHSAPDDDVACVISHARSFIDRILGKLTPKKLAFCEEHMRFGPGATTSLSRKVSQGLKYSKRQLDATPRVADFFVHCLPPLWRGASGPDLALRESSKLTTVPKDSRTDRCICIEPDMNIYVQLGIGALLRKRLRAFGLDLSTQSHNQNAARRAQKCGLTTMDLSSASDTICREAVWALLPVPWVELLLYARVDSTVFNGELIELEKWSSMGNGYTFELETLLFYGVLLGACEASNVWHEEVLAYGDDLIMPSEITDVVTRTLNFLGFSVNREKTFGEGLFYESCGTDFFCGDDVRPFFLRSTDVTFEESMYQYANLARRYSSRIYGGFGCDARLRKLWNGCYRSVSEDRRFHIPDGTGDGGFVADLDFASRQSTVTKARAGWQGWRFKYLHRGGRLSGSDPVGCYVNGVRTCSTDFSRGREAQRSDTRTLTKTGYSNEWPNLGPWIT